MTVSKIFFLIGIGLFACLGCNIQGGLGGQYYNLLWHCKRCAVWTITRNAAKVVEGYMTTVILTYAIVSLLDSCINSFFQWLNFFYSHYLLELGPSLKLLATKNLWLPLTAALLPNLQISEKVGGINHTTHLIFNLEKFLSMFWQQWSQTSRQQHTYCCSK